MLGQQVDVLLCQAPIPPYTVKAVYQHHIHLSGKDGLRQLLQSRTVKGQSRAMLSGNTNDGVDCYQTEVVNANLKAVYFLHAFYPAACVSTYAVVFCDMNGRQMPFSPAPTSSSVPLGLIRRGYVSYRYIGPSVTP